MTREEANTKAKEFIRSVKTDICGDEYCHINVDMTVPFAAALIAAYNAGLEDAGAWHDEQANNVDVRRDASVDADEITFCSVSTRIHDLAAAAIRARKIT